MATTTLFGIPHNYRLIATPETIPVVFIHGWLLSHKYWQPIMDNMARHYTCLAYDLRGFGDSRDHLDQFQPGIPQRAKALASSTSPFGLAAYARDLAELLGQLNFDSVWLVGHSLGGSIALWTAYCYPHLVKGVICLNAGGGIYIEQEFRQFRQLGQQILKVRPSWLRHIPLLPLAFSRSMVSRPLGYRWGVERLRDLLKADFEAALGTLLETTTEAEVHLLPRIVAALHQPLHFIGGCNDPVMNLTFVNHLAGYHQDSISYGPLVTAIPNCGHMAMLEHPQMVANTIRTLIGDQPKSGNAPKAQKVSDSRP